MSKKSRTLSRFISSYNSNIRRVLLRSDKSALSRCTISIAS